MGVPPPPPPPHIKEYSLLQKIGFRAPKMEVQDCKSVFSGSSGSFFKYLCLPSSDRLTQNATCPKYFMADSENNFLKFNLRRVFFIFNVFSNQWKKIIKYLPTYRIHDIWSKTISSKRRLVECDIWSIRHFTDYDVWSTMTIGRNFVELRRNLVEN